MWQLLLFPTEKLSELINITKSQSKLGFIQTQVCLNTELHTLPPPHPFFSFLIPHSSVYWSTSLKRSLFKLKTSLRSVMYLNLMSQ